MATVFNDTAAGGGFGGFGPGFGGFGGYGGGDGLGLLALLLLGGRDGFGRGRGGDDCCDGNDTTALLAAITGLFNNSEGNADTAAILSRLGALEGAIPGASNQIQLALANLAAGLTGQNNANTQAITNMLGQIQLGQLVQSNAIQTAIAGVDTNVDRSTCAIINTIREDGGATRALFTENIIQGLRDDKVILSNQLAEERTEGRRERDRHGVEVTTIVNQNATAVAISQNHNEVRELRALVLDLLQVNRATNQAINIGAGTQTANPLNSQTNVKG